MRRGIWKRVGQVAALSAGVVLLPIVAGLAWGFRLSVPRPKGVESDHWDGRRFRNQEPIPSHGPRELLRWQRTREKGVWGPRTHAEAGPPPVPYVRRGDMRVTFIGHATMLLQMDGINVLTDPVWSERASPVRWAGPRRVRPAGVRFEDLPEIHAVVISHSHYDHMDIRTLQRLDEERAPRFIVGLGNAAMLHRRGIRNVIELDWWESIQLPGEITLTAVPAQHFSARGLFDRNRTLWAGYSFSGPSGTAYFAGDTGWGPHFQQVRERFGRVRLAILPIGAYRPRWFMAPIHISPAEAADAHQVLGAATSVGMHFGTFDLADDGQAEPLDALSTALREKRIDASRFWILGFGESRYVPLLPDLSDGPEPR